MSSSNQGFKIPPTPTPKFRSAAADPSTPSPRLADDKDPENQVSLIRAISQRNIQSADRYTLATKRNANTTPSPRQLLAIARTNIKTIRTSQAKPPPSTRQLLAIARTKIQTLRASKANPSLASAQSSHHHDHPRPPPPPRPHLPPARAYPTPASASLALHLLRLAEKKSTYLASLHHRPTTRDLISPGRTYSPTFPYHPYATAAAAATASPPPAAASSSSAEKEVYALPPSQHLFFSSASKEAKEEEEEEEESVPKCGNCLHPLRFTSLPSRCPKRGCQALNIGDDWARNERFRQAEQGGRWDRNHRLRVRKRQCRRRGQSKQEEKGDYGDDDGDDLLLQWRKAGSRVDQDPVDWDAFVVG